MTLWRPCVTAVLAVAAAASLSGCAKTMESASAKPEAYEMEPIDGTEFNRVTLKPRVAERIGIKTDKVARLVRFGGESDRTTVPHGAVMYEAKGAAFVYTNPSPLVFERHRVTVDYVEDDLAVLVEGPPPGTSVVTVGGAELQGIEFGVGK